MLRCRDDCVRISCLCIRADAIRLADLSDPSNDCGVVKNARHIAVGRIFHFRFSFQANIAYSSLLTSKGVFFLRIFSIEVKFSFSVIDRLSKV